MAADVVAGVAADAAVAAVAAVAVAVTPTDATRQAVPSASTEFPT